MKSIQIVKRGKSFAEMKTFCSKCLTKDNELSSFLGGTQAKFSL